jgi:hypothetical protein
MPGRADDQPLLRDHDSDVLQGARRAAPCPAQHRSRSLPQSSRSRHSVRAGRRISGNRALTPRTGFRTTHKCPAPCQHLSACRRGGFVEREGKPVPELVAFVPEKKSDDGLTIGPQLSELSRRRGSDRQPPARAVGGVREPRALREAGWRQAAAQRVCPMEPFEGMFEVAAPLARVGPIEGRLNTRLSFYLARDTLVPLQHGRLLTLASAPTTRGRHPAPAECWSRKDCPPFRWGEALSSVPRGTRTTRFGRPGGKIGWPSWRRSSPILGMTPTPRTGRAQSTSSCAASPSTTTWRARSGVGPSPSAPRASSWSAAR